MQAHATTSNPHCEQYREHMQFVHFCINTTSMCTQLGLGAHSCCRASSHCSCGSHRTPPRPSTTQTPHPSPPTPPTTTPSTGTAPNSPRKVSKKQHIAAGAAARPRTRCDQPSGPTLAQHAGRARTARKPGIRRVQPPSVSSCRHQHISAKHCKLLHSIREADASPGRRRTARARHAAAHMVSGSGQRVAAPREVGRLDVGLTDCLWEDDIPAHREQG